MFDFRRTATRVEESTSNDVNRKIHDNIREMVAYYADHPAEIDQRLEQLDKEWDIERTLEANAGGLALLTLALGATLSRKWNFVTITVAGFLFNHALNGWCPPIPLFRRMGIRTSREINLERYALKALRGDFNKITSKRDSEMALKAAEG